MRINERRPRARQHRRVKPTADSIACRTPGRTTLRAVACAWLAFALNATGAAASPASSAATRHRPAGAEGGIHFETALKPALQTARRLAKPVMIGFWAEWCPWCRALDETTYRDPHVAELAKDFIAVKVNIEGSLDEARVAADYGVETVPTIGFVSPAGRLFARRDKFESAEVFAATLESVRAAAVDVMAWEQALARDADDAAALARLGGYLFEHDNLKDSRELLRRARGLDGARPAPERKQTRVRLGSLYRRDGKPDDSERVLKEALALQPADPGAEALALFELGETYRSRGRVEQAGAAWRESLRLSPQGPVSSHAREGLARLAPR